MVRSLRRRPKNNADALAFEAKLWLATPIHQSSTLVTLHDALLPNLLSREIKTSTNPICLAY